MDGIGVDGVSVDRAGGVDAAVDVAAMVDDASR